MGNESYVNLKSHVCKKECKIKVMSILNHVCKKQWEKTEVTQGDLHQHLCQQVQSQALCQKSRTLHQGPVEYFLIYGTHVAHLYKMLITKYTGVYTFTQNFNN